MSVQSLAFVSDFYANVPKDRLNPGAGSVVITCIVGMLVVFAVLAIIYLSMLVMSRALASNNNVAVTSPFDCTVQSLTGISRANENDVIAIVVNDKGEVGEILAPTAGVVSLRVSEGSKVKKGQKLFVIQ